MLRVCGIESKFMASERDSYTENVRFWALTEMLLSSLGASEFEYDLNVYAGFFGFESENDAHGDVMERTWFQDENQYAIRLEDGFFNLWFLIDVTGALECLSLDAVEILKEAHTIKDDENKPPFWD